MARLDVLILSAMITASAVPGCGGAEKSPAEAPTATEPRGSASTTVEPEAVPSPPKVESEPVAGDQSDTAEKADEPATEEVFKPERPPMEFLTDRKLSFETNFAASEIGTKTAERCSQEHGSDMQALAACKHEVSARVGLRILRFNQKGGAWWYLVYSKKDLGKSSELALLHKVMCKFGKQTDNTITVELIGKDEMKTGEKLPRQFVVTVPNDYSIDLDDPEYGRMRYTAKYGDLPGQGE